MIKTYYLLTKPGIIVGNLITTAAAFILASKGHIDFRLFLQTLVGLGLVIASACVFNNYIDREADKKMARTKNRPLVKGLITGKKAMVFAIFLGLIGTCILYIYTNLLAVVVALAGFFIYVILYSLLKYHTIYATLVGSVSGAVPPVVGYCAVSNNFDAGALLLFAILVFWQMPHFFAIALYRLKDYTAVPIPVLPIKKGIGATKVQMLLYIIAFIIAANLLTILGYTGYAYQSVATLLGFVWLWLCITGFKVANNQLWARKMFQLSLIVIMGLCIMIAVDVQIDL